MAAAADSMDEGFELGKDDGLSNGLWETCAVGVSDGE